MATLTPKMDYWTDERIHVAINCAMLQLACECPVEILTRLTPAEFSDHVIRIVVRWGVPPPSHEVKFIESPFGAVALGPQVGKIQ